MSNYIGQPVLRREDDRFVTGKGTYTDDIVLPGMTYAAFVRSPYAHAKIISIDSAEAESHPGVVAIYTGEDCGNYGVPCGWQVNFKNGDTMKEPIHPLLAVG
ncbi:MAG: xanthine dehydrogenase family protein molybdopterin-binding subunit, partial [Bacteroidota bacterium]